MHLMYHAQPDGTRLYTLKKSDAAGRISKSAHPGKLQSNHDRFAKLVLWKCTEI